MFIVVSIDIKMRKNLNDGRYICKFKKKRKKAAKQKYKDNDHQDDEHG